MGIAELEREWNAHDIEAEEREWDETREEAAPLYQEAVDDFLAGRLDVPGFRTKIDSLSKSHNWWGFRGTGQMFFNQLVNAAEPQDLADALRDALPPPVSGRDAEDKIAAFQAAIDRARDRADTIGATKPGRGRANFFLTFFWELADREAWPIFFPNSRDVLEQHGLLDTNAEQPQLYLAYRDKLAQLKQQFGTGTWGVEHLLWRLGKGAPEPKPKPEPQVAPPAPAPPAADLYADYRAQGLHFPDEVVTSLVLSLATKRFVILSGISGTGKTQIALGLARHLETLVSPDEAVDLNPPQNTEHDVYIQLTAPKLKRGRTTLDAATRAVLDARVGLPERGAGKPIEATLPDGSRADLRLNNLGFSDPSRQLWLLFFLKSVQTWLADAARPGDYLKLSFDGGQLALDVVHGTAVEPATATTRHAVLAVRSDWTDPRGLLGYYNPLTNSYATTTVVELLLAAANDPDRPYVVVLDEMNLARVEYYFSDFLSALESGDAIQLMAPGVEEELLAAQQDDVPAELPVPPNVSFIGTVNIDETTYAFSPKVLDRANVLEFNLVEPEREFGHPAGASGAGLRLKGGALAPDWLCTTRERALEPRATAYELEAFTEALEDVHAVLERHHMHFGYRVIREVGAFVGHALLKVDGDPEEIARRAFDLQLLQKILPKLSGGRELEEPLGFLLAYSLDASKPPTIDVDAVKAAARSALDAKTARYPGAADKLLRMLDRLAFTGFVSALG